MKRVAAIVLGLPVLAIGLMGLSMLATQVYLAWKHYPTATQPPNWHALAVEEIPSIVTHDSDGSRRITQLWIAAVGDRAYLRTGESRWFANLNADPELDLRIGGMTYPCRVEVVADSAAKDAVNAAFLAKYPSRSAFFRSVGISTTNVLALTCMGEV